MEVFAQNFLKFNGSLVDHSTVRFGSGAGPRLVRVCRKRKDILVTMWRPSMPTPPMDSVTQTGSPENRSLYSGVRANLIRRSFMMKWSMNSWICSSVKVPSFKSLCA